VSGKTIFLATTNGTPALVAAQGGDPVLVGGAVNFKALAERARTVFAEREDLVIVCAGRDGEFALEDAYTAGRLVRVLKRGARKLRLNDAAAAALDLTTHYRDWADALSHSEAARQLAEVDLGDDVAFSGKPDRFSVVPTYADRRIT
jgi:2-phosphosulfolactate phosphatase